MRTEHRVERIARWQLVIAVLASSFASVLVAAPTEQETIPAVFKARQIDFMLRSPNFNYPCYQIENRVANILRAVGARDDIKVSANGCDNVGVSMGDDSGFGVDFGRGDRSDPFGDDRSDPYGRYDRNNDAFRTRNRRREQMVHVRVEMMMPVKVTPELLEELDRDKSRRELISRVTGNPAAAMNDAIVFPAKRQEVVLSRRTIRLEPKDCELLDEMSNRVFRKLDVRVVGRSFNCDRGETSHIPPQLTAEALLPLMMTQPPPAVSQPDPQPAPEETMATPPQTSETPAP